MDQVDTSVFTRPISQKQSSSVHKINNPTVRLKLENLDWIGSRSVKTGSNQKRSDHFSSHRFGSGHDQTEFKSVYSKFVQNILAEGFKRLIQTKIRKKTELYHN